MEDKEKMLSVETDAADDSAERYKELFEYEMTQVRLMLEDEFKTLSSEDMNHAGEIDIAPVTLEVGESEISLPENAVSVSVPESKKPFDSDIGVAVIEGVSVPSLTADGKTLGYTGKDMELDVASGVRIAPSAELSVASGDDLSVESPSVVLPTQSLGLKSDTVEAVCVDVSLEIPENIPSCASAKPTQINVAIDTQLTVEEKHIDVVIPTPEVTLETDASLPPAQLLGDQAAVQGHIELDMPKKEILAVKAPAAPNASFEKGKEANIEISSFSVELAPEKSFSASVSEYVADLAQADLPTAPTIPAVEIPGALVVTMETDSLPESNAAKVVQIPGIEVSAPAIECSAAGDPPSLTVAKNDVSVDIVCDIDVSGMGTMRPEYNKADVHVEAFNVSTGSSVKASSTVIEAPEAQAMPFVDTEVKTVVFVSPVTQVSPMNASTQAPAALEYNKGDTTVELSDQTPIAVRAEITYEGVEPACVEINQPELPAAVFLQASVFECKAEAVEVTLPDANATKDTVDQIRAIAEQTTVPRGMTYEEMCERFSADIDPAKFKLSINGVVESLRTEFKSE